MGKRFTYEEVKEYFESQNCELLEKEYKNARTRMRYRCQCGNISKIVFYSFKIGNRCSECGKNKISKRFTYTQEEAENKFKEIGCELLEEYKGAYEKAKFKCSCGRISKAIPNNIWRRKRCGQCGLESRSGENHYMWHDDRDEFNTRSAFRQRCYKLVQMVLSVTGRVKNKKTAKLLGYDYKQLQEHIINHPNWEKVKNEPWHIDHIFPVKAFLDYGITDLKIINSLGNLQPLSAKENMAKNASYDTNGFLKYLEEKGIEYET